MENDLSPELSQRALLTEDVIEAEWVEVETFPPETDPAITYLVTRPYPNGQKDPSPSANPTDEKTFLDRLLTPWGIAGVLCLLTGNILLSWTQRSPRPKSAVQINSVPTIADTSPAGVNSATFLAPLSHPGNQSLDVSQLSGVKIPIPRTRSRTELSDSVVFPTAGTPLATAILPSSLGSFPLPASLPIAPSPAIAPAIAKAPTPTSSPKQSFPIVLQPKSLQPKSLQPRFLPTLPPPPLLPAPTLPPSAPPPINDQESRQSFNQKTSEQLLNLANQLPSSAENPGIIPQLQQEIQQNQGN